MNFRFSVFLKKKKKKKSGYFWSTPDPILVIRFRYYSMQVGECVKIICFERQIEHPVFHPIGQSCGCALSIAMRWIIGSQLSRITTWATSDRRKTNTYFQGLHKSPHGRRLWEMEEAIAWPKHLAFSICLVGIYVLQKRWILSHNLPQPPNIYHVSKWIQLLHKSRHWQFSSLSGNVF